MKSLEIIKCYLRYLYNKIKVDLRDNDGYNLDCDNPYFDVSDDIYLSINIRSYKFYDRSLIIDFCEFKIYFKYYEVNCDYDIDLFNDVDIYNKVYGLIKINVDGFLKSVEMEHEKTRIWR